MAKTHYPGVDFKKSFMVGNTGSDMQFGRNIGAFTVFLTTTKPEEKDENRQRIDRYYPGLADFAKDLS